MAAQAGKDMTIEIGVATSPHGYADLAALRTTRFAFNQTGIDVTNADSTARWREMLDQGGIRTLDVEGEGVFTDATTDATLRTEFLDDTANPWLRLTIPDFVTVEGAFKITSLEYSGTHDGEVAFSVSMQSAGAMTISTL